QLQIPQPDRTLADEGPVRRDLLPQRGDLLRQGHPAHAVRPLRQPAGARRLSLHRPFGEPVRHHRAVQAARPQHPSQDRVRPSLAGKKIRVLIVDDSALIRQLLTAAPSSDPAIDAVGAAPDPLIARSMIKELNPDVLTLDVEMPNMDGISFLEKIMRLRPMPVVMVSTLTQKGAAITMQALEMGAVDFVPKPTLDIKHALEEIRHELIAKVKTASTARVVARSRPAEGQATRRLTPGPGFTSTDIIVAIGSSTGGVEALKEVITILPPDSPPILITQHMPPRFTGSFAARLDSLSAVTVTEAKDNVRVFPGHVYIAPGDYHLTLHRSG